MSNGTRHGIGVLAGLVLTAALGGLLVFGTYKLQHGYFTTGHKSDKYLAGGLFVAAAIVFGLLAASRISPIAALIAGVVFAGVGVVFFVSTTKTTTDMVNKFPFKHQRPSVNQLETTGTFLLIGVGLLFSAVFPSRWRPTVPRPTTEPKYEYGVPEAPSPYDLDSPSYGRHTQQYAEQHPHYEPPPYEPPPATGDQLGRHLFSASEDTHRDEPSTQELPRRYPD